MAGLAGKGHGMEGPDELAGLCIPGAGVARWTDASILAAGAFAGACTGNDQVFVDGRRRGQDVALVHAGLHHLGRLEVDHTVHAEVSVELAGSRAD